MPARLFGRRPKKKTDAPPSGLDALYECYESETKGERARRRALARAVASARAKPTNGRPPTRSGTGPTSGSHGRTEAESFFNCFQSRSGQLSGSQSETRERPRQILPERVTLPIPSARFWAAMRIASIAASRSLSVNVMLGSTPWIRATSDGVESLGLFSSWVRAKNFTVQGVTLCAYQVHVCAAA